MAEQTARKKTHRNSSFSPLRALYTDKVQEGECREIGSWALPFSIPLVLGRQSEQRQVAVMVQPSFLAVVGLAAGEGEETGGK